MSLVAVVLTLLSAPSLLHAQEAEESYKFDIGAGIGISGYLGDANESNLFKHTGFAGNIEGRYLINSRWALRAQMTYASISGNSADFDNKFPFDKQYDFKGGLFSIGFRGEANFFNYGIGETYKRMRRWTPFLSLGIGLAGSTVDGTTNMGFEIPMGAGFKFKIKKRINLIGEFTMTKVFSDKIDNFKDPYEIKSSFLKNTDWYATFMVGISYEFGPRCTVCNRLD